MKILSLSDKKVTFIYNPAVNKRFKQIDLIVGCGDLPYYYLEFVLSALNAPLFYVRGNHDLELEYSTSGKRKFPHGGINLHRKIVHYNGTILAGIEGSIRYKPGKFQYTQNEMWYSVLMFVPKLIINRIKTGRYLDIFVTHAPPSGIHDRDDHVHQGINAFRWFIKVFQPSIHFHGHIHIYRPDENVESKFGNTRVINSFGFQETYLFE